MRSTPSLTIIGTLLWTGFILGSAALGIPGCSCVGSTKLDCGVGDSCDLDTGDSDTMDTDTGDPNTGDSDTGDPDTGDPDTGDPDTGDPDTAGDVDDCPVYADANLAPGGSGTYDDPCASIADAIELLPPGCLSIRLFPATFPENVDYGGLDLDIQSLEGPEVTIIEPPSGGSVVTIAQGESPAALLLGVTLRGGTGTTGHSGTEEGLAYGGGLFIYESSPTIQGCVIEHNEVDGGYGAGGYMHGYGGQFVDNQVIDNTATKEDDEAGGGGGLRMEECTGTISNNVFEGNSALGESADGGAIEIWYGGPVVSHNVFRSNLSTETGGAIRSGYSSADIHNNLLLANQPDAIHLSYDDSGPITHNTFVANTPYTLTTRTCCGYEGVGPTSEVVGNILADSGEVAVSVTGDLALASFAYNDVYGAGTTLFDGLADPTGSEGNVSIEPDLIDVSSSDPADWDLHLAVDSPLVDAGDPAAADPDGSAADIGAYGGAEAGAWDRDGDGYPEWWQPGPYDTSSYPALGWDCDDDDDGVYPGLVADGQLGAPVAHTYGTMPPGILVPRQTSRLR